MREKIAVILWTKVAYRQLEWCTNYIDDHSMPNLRQGDFYQYADQILELISEEIKRVENPYLEMANNTKALYWEEGLQSDAIEEFRNKILELLNV